MSTEAYIVIGIIVGLSAIITYIIYRLQHKKFFFGWGNIKFVIKELVKTFSNQPSFFSSKRIERALFVGTGMGSIVYYIVANITKLSSGEIIALSSVLLACGGYLLKQTQTENASKIIKGESESEESKKQREEKEKENKEKNANSDVS